MDAAKKDAITCFSPTKKIFNSTNKKGLVFDTKMISNCVSN